MAVVVKLAEALLRRKELQQKVDQLRPIREQKLFEIKVARRPAHEGVDDIVATVPKISMAQVAHDYDWHAKQLRKVDAAIQNTNWNTTLELDESVMADYIDPYVREKD
jgi:hypothetical protein